MTAPPCYIVVECRHVAGTEFCKHCRHVDGLPATADGYRAAVLTVEPVLVDPDGHLVPEDAWYARHGWTTRVRVT